MRIMIMIMITTRTCSCEKLVENDFFRGEFVN